MLSRQLENVINSTFRDAKSKQQEFMTVEHLLLALLGDDETSGILHSAGAEIDELRDELANHRRVWGAARFSWWLTTLLHRFPEQGAFDLKAQEQELNYLSSSDSYMKAVCDQYAGLPFED